MQDKTTIGITDAYREFIAALVEEVVLEGKPFEEQKKWLCRYSEAEGLDYGTLEGKLNDLFKAVNELKERESETIECSVSALGKDCYLSEDLVSRFLDNAAAIRAQNETDKLEQEKTARIEQERLAAEKEAKKEARKKAREEAKKKKAEEKEALRLAEVEAERNRQQLIEKNRIPVKIILISLGVISIVDIIFLRWWCVIPLLFNAYMGMLAYEKCGQGEVGYEKLVFKGGSLVVILFFASFLHWWSLLLILPAIYFIIGDDDNWDLK